MLQANSLQTNKRTIICHIISLDLYYDFNLDYIILALNEYNAMHCIHLSIKGMCLCSDVALKTVLVSHKKEGYQLIIICCI